MCTSLWITQNIDRLDIWNWMTFLKFLQTFALSDKFEWVSNKWNIMCSISINLTYHEKVILNHIEGLNLIIRFICLLLKLRAKPCKFLDYYLISKLYLDRNQQQLELLYLQTTMYCFWVYNSKFLFLVISESQFPSRCNYL